jgi:glycosyltransferase involved in cell wall biosynthesis
MRLNGILKCMRLEIAIPFYGDPDLLKAAVSSVLSQSNSNWTLLVVDDGYPDGSISRWFDELNDERIKYVRNESNLGANRNFQKCIDLIENEYCTIMGADDLLQENYVACMIDLIRTFPGSAMFLGGVNVVDDAGKTVFPIADRVKQALRPSSDTPLEYSGESIARSLMLGNWLYFPAMVWDSKAIKEIGFRSNLNVCQDLALSIDLFMNGRSIVLTEQKCFSYRRSESSDSSIRAIKGDRFDEERKFFGQLAAEFAHIGWKNASRAAKLRVSSRAHALFMIPKVRSDMSAIRRLLRHATSS